MEYLDGIDLETLISEYGPQPAGRVAHILAQVCGALFEAHASGLIHRDIKPANIILCERGRVPDVAKVLDFGLVKDVEADPGISAQTVAGTPAYISPEGVTDPLDVGPASDIYSLAAVGYRMLTAKLVFEAPNEVGMCVQHASTKPQPPTQRTDNPISERFEQLIMQCLDKAPSRRPASAAELGDVLRALPDAEGWSEAIAAEWWRAYRESDRHPAEQQQPDTAQMMPLEVTLELRRESGES
jgi:serine/threonine-protein kinase